MDVKSAASLLFAIVFLASAPSFAQTASLALVSDKTDLAPGESFSSSIVLDRADGIVGCTVTVEYPSDKVELSEAPASSAFFVTFNDDRENAEPSQIEPWEMNAGQSGLLRLAGVYVDEQGMGAYTGEQTLFTLGFRVLDGVSGPFSIRLKQTELFNPDAGWGIDKDGDGFYGEGDETGKAPILIKANEIGSENEFEVALESFAVEPLKMFKVSSPGVDTDGDGLSDVVESDCCTFFDDPDSDNDGLWDGVEDRGAGCDYENVEDYPPCNWDFDGDGIADGDEDRNKNGVTEIDETDPLDGDTDGDFTGDGLEIAYGMDPLDGSSGFYVVCIGECDRENECHECVDSIAGAMGSNPGQDHFYVRARKDEITESEMTLGRQGAILVLESGVVNVGQPQ